MHYALTSLFYGYVYYAMNLYSISVLHNVRTNGTESARHNGYIRVCIMVPALMLFCCRGN